MAFWVKGPSLHCVLSVVFNLLYAGPEQLETSNLRAAGINMSCGHDISFRRKSLGEALPLAWLLWCILLSITHLEKSHFYTTGAWQKGALGSPKKLV